MLYMIRVVVHLMELDFGRGLKEEKAYPSICN